ncbi:hypothetical protein E4U42_002089, partial [Claviceps africana]
MKFLILSLGVCAAAAPIPGSAPLMDIKTGDFAFPVNVLGLQTHDVSAANGNLAGNAANGNGQGHGSSNGQQSPTPMAGSARPVAAAPAAAPA